MSSSGRVSSDTTTFSLFAAIFASALLMLSSQPAAGQRMPGAIPEQGPNILTIQVVGWGDTAPLNLVNVELSRGDRSGRRRATSSFGVPDLEGYCDAKGFRTFMGLPDGDYTVSIAAPGSVVSPAYVHLIGGTQERVVFQLGPAGGQGRREPADTVPVQWLAVPEKARRRFARAQEEYDRCKYDSAAKELEAALAVDPSFVIAHDLLGLTRWHMQRTELAKESFENSLRLDPKFLPTYLDYAGVLTEMGDFERAGQVLDEAVKKRPDSPDLYYAMARMHFASGKLDPAEQDCRRVLERDRNKIPDVHLMLSNIYLRRHRFDQVATELETYLLRAPTGMFAKAARESLAKIKKQIGPAKGQ